MDENENYGENQDSLFEILRFAAQAAVSINGRPIEKQCTKHSAVSFSDIARSATPPGNLGGTRSRRIIMRHVRRLERGKVESIPKRSPPGGAGGDLHGKASGELL